MKIEPPRHLLIGGMEMSIGKSDPIISPKQKRCQNVLLTTEYDPDYVIRMADGSRLDLCDGSHIVTFQDNLLALSSNRQQRLGIHLLAANTGIPVTVLEHPTLSLFKHILTKEHYDYVGFSTIVPALEKIEKMIQICREVSPHSRIIIGGHGVEHGYATRIGADHICRGEGIAYLQKLLGTNVEGFPPSSVTLSSYSQSPARYPWDKYNG